jgi:hypothetical protein
MAEYHPLKIIYKVQRLALALSSRILQWVGASRTTPAPAKTVTVMGTGSHRPTVPAVCYKKTRSVVKTHNVVKTQVSSARNG